MGLVQPTKQAVSSCRSKGVGVVVMWVLPVLRSGQSYLEYDVYHVCIPSL
jgi:hypothetical protein